MQRSKIKVGAEYAVTNYRDWWKHPIKGAQVIDVGYWYHLSNWDKDGIAAAPDTVQDPDLSNPAIEVPGSIRRGDGRFSRDRNTVLVRNIIEKDGERTYGKPYTVATRDLVAPIAEAQTRREEYQTRTAAEAKVAREKRERRATEEEQFNTRLASFGAGPVGRNYYSGDRFVLDAATLEVLLTHAETWRSHLCEVAPERPDDWPEVR